MTSLVVEPVNPCIGAFVSGVDLREPLDAAEKKTIEEALFRHGVLFFRNQDLTPEEHHRVKMLLQLGTATTGEIAEQIRVERDASNKSSKRRSKKKGKTRSWLF